MKRFAAISTTSVLIIALLLSLIVPHHHHTEEACAAVETCAIDGVVNDSHTPHQESNDEAPFCVNHCSVRSFGTPGTHLTRLGDFFIDNSYDLHIYPLFYAFVSLLIAYFSLYAFKKIRFREIISIYKPYQLLSPNGLRAPPSFC